MNLKAAVAVTVCRSELVTTTSTVPAAWDGAKQVRVVAVVARIEQALPPKVTVESDAKLLPVMVTEEPDPPEAGEIEEKVGEGL